MKPFNLAEALAGKPVVTRDGRNVTDIHHLPTAAPYVVVGVVSGNVHTFTEQGQFNVISHRDTEFDLFMASEKKRGWVNVYRRIATYGGIYPTEEAAKAQRSNKAVATVPIEWEE